MTKSTRSPNRSVQEILRCQEAKIAALRERAAMEEAKLNPSLLPIVTELEAATKNIISHAKLLGNGPQSCATRRTSHELWLNVIEAEETHAHYAEKYERTVKEYFQGVLPELYTMSANGEDLEGAVARILDEVPSQPKALIAAEEAMLRARDERVHQTKAKAMPKRAQASS
jgi:hypothetical protein